MKRAINCNINVLECISSRRPAASVDFIVTHIRESP